MKLNGLLRLRPELIWFLLEVNARFFGIISNMTAMQLHELGLQDWSFLWYSKMQTKSQNFFSSGTIYMLLYLGKNRSVFHPSPGPMLCLHFLPIFALVPYIKRWCSGFNFAVIKEEHTNALRCFTCPVGFALMIRNFHGRKVHIFY